MRLRKFQISASLFWGWQSTLDIDEYDTIEKIVTHVKFELKQYFRQANLEDLVEKVATMNLHCHTHDNVFEDSANFDYNREIIYLCDHC